MAVEVTSEYSMYGVVNDGLPPTLFGTQRWSGGHAWLGYRWKDKLHAVAAAAMTHGQTWRARKT